MKTALVTGASGYLGGHVARKLLAEGWRVIALVRSSSRLADDLVVQVVPAEYDGTLKSVRRAFRHGHINVVIHLASAVVGVHTSEQLDEIIDANIRLPTYILEAMRESSCTHIINTGSFWQYCNSDTYTPVNLYAATKQALEDIARAYVENDGMTMSTLVLFDTYGADDPRKKIVQLLVEAADAPEPLLLSPGEQILDLTHSADVAEAFVTAAGRIMHEAGPKLERFRVSGTRLSLQALVELTQRLAGTPLNVRLGARNYREREIMVPVQNALPSLPGWTARHRLDHDISAMLEARRRNT